MLRESAPYGQLVVIYFCGRHTEEYILKCVGFGPYETPVVCNISVINIIYIYIYIHIYKYGCTAVQGPMVFCMHMNHKNIGSRGCESDREVLFVSFVRACERSCVWPRDDDVFVAGLWKLAACSGARPYVPCPSLRRHAVALNHVN